MHKKRQEALKLRLAGKSYNEITRLLEIPKSTLSGWFTGLVLPTRARERLQKRVAQGSFRGLMKRNKNQTHLARERVRVIRNKSKSEIQSITKNELKMIGLALYWAEGYKRLIKKNGREVTYHPVSLSNSDPELIQTFLRFLREVCGVADQDIDADIRIFDHMSEKELLLFWQKVTGIPQGNFKKTYYGVSKSSLGKRPFNILPYGTIAIRVNNTKLFHQIMGWLEGLAKIGSACNT